MSKLKKKLDYVLAAKLPKITGKQKMKNRSTDRLLTLPALHQKIKKIDYNKQLDPFIKKMSINESIKMREKDLSSFKRNKMIGYVEPESIQQRKNAKFYYNDLTPNRNLNGFNFYNFLSQKKLKNYCEKFINYDRQSYVNDTGRSFLNYKMTINTALKNEIE